MAFAFLYPPGWSHSVHRAARGMPVFPDGAGNPIAGHAGDRLGCTNWSRTMHCEFTRVLHDGEEINPSVGHPHPELLK